jgi:hypothetical protein
MPGQVFYNIKVPEEEDDKVPKTLAIKEGVATEGSFI